MKSIWKTTNELTDITEITFADLDSSVWSALIFDVLLLRKIVSDVVAVLIQVFYSQCLGDALLNEIIENTEK